MYEARAIARYLVRKYRPESNLVPSSEDLQKCALFEQAMSVEAFDFAPHAYGIIYEKGMKPYVCFVFSKGHKRN